MNKAYGTELVFQIVNLKTRNPCFSHLLFHCKIFSYFDLFVIYSGITVFVVFPVKIIIYLWDKVSFSPHYNDSTTF